MVYNKLGKSKFASSTLGALKKGKKVAEKVGQVIAGTIYPAGGQLDEESKKEVKKQIKKFGKNSKEAMMAVASTLYPVIRGREKRK